MTESSSARKRLEAALAAGDLEEARAAARALASSDDELTLAIERLQHTTRLAELGQLAAEIVHEMRQPLVGVKAYAQIIELTPNNVEIVKTKAAGIVQQADRMEALLERIRNYVRGRSVATGRASLNGAVSGALELLEHQLSRTKLRVEKELAAGLPDVRVEPMDLQQIVVNLVINAREALAGRDGTIRLRTALTPGAVELTVADDGPGIAATLRPRLFRPFATAKPDGTGLGLYVSRATAERAGGTLELVDAPKGASFRLRLPSG